MAAGNINQLYNVQFYGYTKQDRAIKITQIQGYNYIK